MISINGNSEVRANDFLKIPSFGLAFHEINSVISSSFPTFMEHAKEMWDTLQNNFHFENCDIYRYVPVNSEFDPQADAL